MLRTLLTIAFTFSLIYTNAQIVNIPDPNFKAALVNHTTPVIDTNGDGEIQVSEAEATNQVFVTNQFISELTGIEAFINLETLVCGTNPLTSMDLSGNVNLITLDARDCILESVNITQNVNLMNIALSDNGLTDLDLSQNINMDYLDLRFNLFTSIDLSANVNLVSARLSFCNLESVQLGNKPLLELLLMGGNGLTQLDVSQAPLLEALTLHFSELTELDLSNNPVLRILRCYDNNLEHLDLSSNPLLEELYCYTNPLQSLNLRSGGNSELLVMQANDNPNLECIQVDDEVMATAGMGPYENWLKDASAAYAEDCMYLELDAIANSKVVLFPNPGGSTITVKSQWPLDRVDIYGSIGQLVRSILNPPSALDISDLEPGAYIMKVAYEGFVKTVVFIKN